MLRMQFLRRVFILALSILSKGSHGLATPAMWLLHYLKGSGEPLEAPEWCVKEAASAIALAVVSHARNWRVWDVHEIKAGRYCLGHSTLYEGHGFYGRPTLFYLVGGFSFTYKEGAISGTDVYDWHPTQEGQYFTSPLGSSWWVNLAVAVAGAIFGRQYFVTNGFPSGETGISNRLWEDLEKVGARPFVTTISLSGESLMEAIQYWIDLFSEDPDLRDRYEYGTDVAEREEKERDFLGCTAEEFLESRPWLKADFQFINGGESPEGGDAY